VLGERARDQGRQTAQTDPLQPGAWDSARLELAAEGIAVKVRWLGVLLGVALVEFRAAAGETEGHLLGLRCLLFMGALYALLDTSFSLRGRVLLQQSPLVISVLESIFIGLLCHFDFGKGVVSPFRYYFLLSLISCAIRYDKRTAYTTWLLHSISYTTVPMLEASGFPSVGWDYLITVAVLFWVTWASTALANLLKEARSAVERLNAELQQSQKTLEQRIRDRTQELQEMQATLLHQEKMAAFGLLAAGIAHEVGNPLASISSLVQLLQRRHQDDYTRQKLHLVEQQLGRIQGILRELIDFSRPASSEVKRIHLKQVLEESLSIARYYKGGKARRLELQCGPDVPVLCANRDQLVQLFLNLVLNAIDATGQGGLIRVRATYRPEQKQVQVAVEDDGPGVPEELREQIFQPFFTTKPNGTGLGLFVCRKIVHQLAGSLILDRSELGGAAFRVQLPVADWAGPETPEATVVAAVDPRSAACRRSELGLGAFHDDGQP
jgi:two-component system NtrC family sensor kinase